MSSEAKISAENIGDAKVVEGNNYEVQHGNRLTAQGDIHGDPILGDKIVNKYYGEKKLTPDEIRENRKEIQKQIAELYETQKKKLKNKAKIDVGTVDSPIPEEHRVKINIAPLEISTQDRDWSQMGLLHHRENQLKFFENETRNTDSTSRVAHDKLFERSLAQATKQAQNLTLNEEAAKTFVSIHGNIVGVIGHAGIGKTTLTKELVNKALDEQQNLFGKIDFVFHLRFRLIKMNDQEMNLLQFLTNDATYLKDRSEDEIKGFIKKLENDSEVLIVMDGYDEAARKCMNREFEESEKCTVDQKATAETFIKNLFKGNILRHAKKLITSRPQQMYEMREHFKPKFVVNLLGLDRKSQEKICGDIVQNDQKRKQEIIEFLKNHQDLRSYCYVPAVCIIIMFCVDVNLQEVGNNPEGIMDSLTTIMVTALRLFIKAHLHSKSKEDPKVFQIVKLCELAYTGFKDDRYQFSLNDLKQLGIDSQYAAAFFAIGRVKKLKFWEGEEEQYYFSHLILQELCVAMYIKLYMSFSEFEKDVAPKLESSKYQMVTKLLFGMCNGSTRKFLKKLHDEVCGQQELDLSKEDDKSSTETLKNLVNNQVQKFSRDTTKKNIFSVFQICSWLYEMRDNEFTEGVVSKMQDKLVVTGEILPNDVPGFYYMLRWRKTPIALSVVAPSFLEESLKSFFIEMKKTFEKKSKMKLTKLKFKSDNIGDEGAEYIASCLDKIDQLYLVACPLTDKGLENLSKAIQSKGSQPCKLERLDLCAIKIDDKGAEQLKMCIGGIRKVKLQLCDLNETAIETLTKGMIQGSQLTELNLSEGAIGDKGAEYLATCIPSIKKLILKFCNITDAGVESLSKAIEKTSLDLLDLSENIIKNEGAKHLAVCIAKIGTLILEYCYIDANGAESLANALGQSRHQMEELYLLNNKIGDKGFEVMSICLTKMRKLSIGDCNDMYLSFNGVKAFTEGIKRASSLKELSLCCRRSFEDKAKRELMTCKQYVGAIYFQNASLSKL